jgi:hypothetical protein
MVGGEREAKYWDATARSYTRYVIASERVDPFLLTPVMTDFAKIVFFVGFLLMCCANINVYTVRTKIKSWFTFHEVDTSWLSSKRLTNTLRALFPAPSARATKEKKKMNFQAAFTLPMIMMVCYKYLVFPTADQIKGRWQPGQVFITATAFLLMCYTGCRPCQVTWNPWRAPYIDHNILVPEVVLSFVKPDGTIGHCTARMDEVRLAALGIFRETLPSQR